MPPDLAISALLGVLSLIHEVDTLAGEPGNAALRAQLANEYAAKAWGGMFGMTPRPGPALQQRERAVLPWAQAVGGLMEQNRRLFGRS